MWNLRAGARFLATPPNHPEALLEEPQASQAVGENIYFPGTAKLLPYDTYIEFLCLGPKKCPIAHRCS